VDRKRLFTALTVAGWLNCSRQTVYRLAESGQLRSHCIGRKVLFFEDDVNEYIRKCGRPDVDYWKRLTEGL
jgi:excisionase family DNA binding protein